LTIFSEFLKHFGDGLSKGRGLEFAIFDRKLGAKNLHYFQGPAKSYHPSTEYVPEEYKKGKGKPIEWHLDEFGAGRLCVKMAALVHPNYREKAEKLAEKMIRPKAKDRERIDSARVKFFAMFPNIVDRCF